MDRSSARGGEVRGEHGADRVAGTAGRPTALIGEDRAREFQRRWTELKGDFVEEPRYAVHRADDLVGDVLDELEGLVRAQRSELGHGLDKDHTTTEDLRIALSRYRGFLERLLSF